MGRWSQPILSTGEQPRATLGRAGYRMALQMCSGSCAIILVPLSDRPRHAVSSGHSHKTDTLRGNMHRSYFHNPQTSYTMPVLDAFTLRISRYVFCRYHYPTRLWYDVRLERENGSTFRQVLTLAGHMKTRVTMVLRIAALLLVAGLINTCGVLYLENSTLAQLLTQQQVSALSPDVRKILMRDLESSDPQRLTNWIPYFAHSLELQSNFQGG